MAADKAHRVSQGRADKVESKEEDQDCVSVTESYGGNSLMFAMPELVCSDRMLDHQARTLELEIEEDPAWPWDPGPGLGETQ